MKTDLNFKNDPVKKLLTKMAIPAIIAMVVNGLYYLVDAAFVGWGVGSIGLAGLAVVFPVQMFMIAWGSMIGMGTASIISRKLGENDKTTSGKAAGNSIVLGGLSGILFTFLTVKFQLPMISGLGATENTILPAQEYIATLQWGFPFVFLSMVGFNLLRTQGEAKKAAMGMLIGTLINLILDPVFIFTFNMGVKGAALATVIARVISTLYFAFHLIGKERVIKLRISFFKPEPALIGQIFTLGLGNFLSQFCLSLVAVIMNVSLRNLGSEIDLAVYGVLSRILVFITMPLIGLAQGFQPIAGYNYGARLPGKVKEVTKLSLISASVIGLAMFILPMFFPELVMGIFAEDAELVTAGILPLRITLAMLPLIGFQIIGFAFFQAVGKPLPTLLLSLSRQFLFLVPLLIILPLSLGSKGLWLAYPAADALSIALSAILLSGFWRQNKSTKSDMVLEKA